jgi:FkbM family methyltransferase
MNRMGLVRELGRVRPIGPVNQYVSAMARFGVARLTSHKHRPTFLTNYFESPFWLRYRGMQFVMDPESRLDMYFLVAVSEPLAYAKMNSITGKLFVDVGSSGGGYSIPLSRRFEEVIAIEPNSVSLRILESNAKANNIQNLSVVNAAAGRSVGRARVYESPCFSTWSTVDSSPKSIETLQVTLDSVIDSHAHPDLVKVDTEGAEVDVLMGASSCLDRTRCLLIEVREANLATVTNLLERAGFKVVSLDRSGVSRNIWASRPV